MIKQEEQKQKKTDDGHTLPGVNQCQKQKETNLEEEHGAHLVVHQRVRGVQVLGRLSSSMQRGRALESNEPSNRLVAWLGLGYVWWISRDVRLDGLPDLVHFT